MYIKVFPIGYIFLLTISLMLQGVGQCRNQGQRRQQLRQEAAASRQRQRSGQHRKLARRSRRQSQRGSARGEATARRPTVFWRRQWRWHRFARQMRRLAPWWCAGDHHTHTHHLPQYRTLTNNNRY